MSVFIVRLCARTCRVLFAHLAVCLVRPSGRSVSRSVGLELPKITRKRFSASRTARPGWECTSLVAFDC
jgi:hypothetical protein